MKTISNRDAVWYIQNQKPFKNHGGTFTGIVEAEMPPQGRMSNDEYARVFKDWHANGSLYIVLSYSTPIAWAPIGCSDFKVAEQSHSATTRRHKAITDTAINGDKVHNINDFQKEKAAMNIKPGQKAPDFHRDQFRIFTQDGVETLRLEAGETLGLYSLIGSLGGIAKAWGWVLPEEVTDVNKLKDFSVKSWPLATRHFIDNGGSPDQCGTIQFIAKVDNNG